MSGQILTFTNLFPSRARPRHGCFVEDRMRRVAAATGYDWQVVCPVPRVPWWLRFRANDRLLAAEPEHEVVGGVSVRHVPYLHFPGISVTRQADRVFRAALPVVRELCAGRPTVLDAHYAWPDGVAAARIGAELGLPVVVTARGADVYLLGQNPQVRATMRETLLGPNVVRRFAVSDVLRDQFREVLGDTAVETSRNGVDLERFVPGDRAAARRELSLPADVPIVLGVGRIMRHKGFHLAARALARHAPEAHLALIGEGDARATIAAELPAERLHFLGRRDADDVARAFRAADVSTLPSEREGWPNVVTESLASGCPVVATPVGGIPQILDGDPVGTLVAVGDVDALGRAIRAFLDSPPDPVQARALAERYSWEDTVSMLSDVFRQALHP